MVVGAPGVPENVISTSPDGRGGPGRGFPFAAAGTCRIVPAPRATASVRREFLCLACIDYTFILFLPIPDEIEFFPAFPSEASPKE